MRNIYKITRQFQKLSKVGRHRTMATLVGAEYEELSQSSMECIALEHEFGANNYHPLPVVLKKGEGMFYVFIIVFK